MANFLGALPYNIGADFMGRGRKRRSSGRRGQGSPGQQAANYRANQAASFVRPDLPGAPSRDVALLPASFPTFAFALATGTNIIQQQMNPQTPFRGQRLTAVVIRNGASAATTAPLINQLQVGQKPIITTANGVALEVFNQNAFDTNLLFPPTQPGIIYICGIQLTTALTTTDTILCLVAVIGSGIM
jgi:hypothetical protein